MSTSAKQILLVFFITLFYSQAVLVALDTSSPPQIQALELKKVMSNTHPEYLYKILSQEDWQNSLLAKQLQLPAMDTEFIHLATEQQLDRIAKKFWPGLEHIILKIEAKKMIGLLKHEKNPGGNTKYFHLYDGNIPLDAIQEVTVISENS